MDFALSGLVALVGLVRRALPYAIDLRLSAFHRSIARNPLHKLARVLILASLLILLVGCERYNYKNIFPLTKSEWAQAQRYQKGEPCFVLTFSVKDFETARQRFHDVGYRGWRSLEGGTIYVHDLGFNTDSFGGKDAAAVYSQREKKMKGVCPFMIYYPRAEKFVLVVSDGFFL